MLELAASEREEGFGGAVEAYNGLKELRLAHEVGLPPRDVDAVAEVDEISSVGELVEEELVASPWG